MSIVAASNVEKAFFAQVVLGGVSFQIEPGDHVGLIGANGTGKTTLLRIIEGSLKPDRGSISRARGLRIGFLAQEASFDDEHTVRQVALDAFDRLVQIERRLRGLEADLSATEAANEHARLHDQFEHGGGYTFRKRTEEVLEGLGFGRESFDRPASALSGGEKSRVALARLLLVQPDLLLLDEATNHLDIESTEWLETFLGRYQGAFVLATHDRYFLDRVAGRIFELEDHKLTGYKGNYSAYVQQKQERLKRLKRVYDRQQEHIAREEDFIRRNIAGQRVAEARGRRKRLARLERIEKPRLHRKSVRLEFEPSVCGGEIVLRVEQLAKRYDDLELFRDLTCEVVRGDRIGIVGPNGAGKTTLLKLILGEEQPSAGACRLGHNIVAGYYAQHRIDVNPDNDVIHEMWAARPDADATPLRSYLGRFLFSGDEVFKRVGDLSGGEQARVALAKLMLSGANFLLLDEPTNHLDIPSRRALEDAIQNFDGTILLVTHDRYLLNKIVRKVLAIGHGTARVYQVRYAHCEERIRRQFHPPKDAPAPPPMARPRRRSRRKPKRSKRSAPTFEKLEHLIMQREEELEYVEWQLADPEIFRYTDKLRRLKQEHAAIKKKLDGLHQEWDEWVDELAGVDPEA